MITIIIRNWRKAALLLAAAGTAATISACGGGGGSSAADFCGQLQTMSIKFTGLFRSVVGAFVVGRSG